VAFVPSAKTRTKPKFQIAAQADAAEGIRQGLEDVKKGRVRPAREALELFRSVHEIPRSADRPLLARHRNNLKLRRRRCVPARAHDTP